MKAANTDKVKHIGHKWGMCSSNKTKDSFPEGVRFRNFSINSSPVKLFVQKQIGFQINMGWQLLDLLIQENYPILTSCQCYGHCEFSTFPAVFEQP